MSNKFNKIQKNVKAYNLDSLYNNMTPEQHKKSIQMAVAQTRLDMANFYEKEYRKLYNDLNDEYKKEMLEVIDTMSVEMLYELAVQMNVFNEDDDWRKNQIIDKVQEIYTHVMDAIQAYATEDKKAAEKEYEEKKQKVEKIFNLKFGG